MSQVPPKACGEAGSSSTTVNGFSSNDLDAGAASRAAGGRRSVVWLGSCLFRFVCGEVMLPRRRACMMAAHVAIDAGGGRFSGVWAPLASAGRASAMTSNISL